MLGSTAAARVPKRVSTRSRSKYAAEPVTSWSCGISRARKYGRAIREYAGSSQTNVIDDPSPSMRLIVSMALSPAGPAPITTCCAMARLYLPLRGETTDNGRMNTTTVGGPLDTPPKEGGYSG